MAPRHVAGFLAGFALFAASGAHAFEVQCGPEGGDAFGWSIASGRDFDGDAFPDIAIGAPCSSVGSDVHVGRVKIFSGKTGALVMSVTGDDPEQLFGSALDWLPDVDGDGRAELIVGSATFTAPKPGGGIILGAGKVDLLSSNGEVLWSVDGTNQNATFGESVAAVGDMNGDGKADVAVGASGTQVAGKVRGSGFLLSGTSGGQLGRTNGVDEEEQWGSLVGDAGDMDGDGKRDWLASSRVALPQETEEEPPVEGGVEESTTTTTTSTTTTTLAPRAGHVSVLGAVSPYPVIQDFYGETIVDRLGRSAVPAGDRDGDLLGDLWIGAPGAEPNALEDAGHVALYSATGEILVDIDEPSPQRSANFGTAITVPGSLDGGTTTDVVAGAPLAKVLGNSQAGRVHAYDGDDGDWLWSQSGTFPLARFGQTLASGIDYDDDGVGDVVVGAPGDTPDGKRGAGSVTILSGGKNGARVKSFEGRRGRESRVFVSGLGLGREPVVKSFDPFAHRREAEIRPFRGQATTRLSMAILDDGRRQETLNGAKTKLAIGTGRGGASPEVAVYRASRRRQRISLFTAGPAAYQGGLNVAGGELATTRAGEELAIAPADATADGAVPVQIWWAEFPFPSGQIGWSKLREFPAFIASDKYNNVAINAAGASLAAGDLHQNTGEELAIGPAAGLPVIRVVGAAGTKLAEWLAYPPTNGMNGLSIAVGNLDGEREMEIITAPASGQPWVRAWNADKFEGTAYPGDPDGFTVKEFGLQFRGGLVVATADVDFDGQAEIIVAPGSGASPQILAFEANGTLVDGWVVYEPFGPGSSQSLGLVGTDYFWKP